MKLVKLGKVQTLSGTLLRNIFFAMLMISRLCMYSIPIGKSPINLFLLISKMVVLFSRVISSGKHPDKELPDRINSSNLPPMSPMLLGMHPVNLLFASTTTEAVELPKFSGMLE